MSYRHSSYRKLSKTLTKGFRIFEDTTFSRTEMARVAHWSGLPIPPKPDSWGRRA
jgi:hypothetical protein